VTAADFGQEPTVRCPACLEHLPLEEDWLGQVIDCPRAGCEGRIRVNLFIAGPPQKWRAAGSAPRSQSERRPWWAFRRRGR
jgi:hypothetical protein